MTWPWVRREELNRALEECARLRAAINRMADNALHAAGVAPIFEPDAERFRVKSAAEQIAAVSRDARPLSAKEWRARLEKEQAELAERDRRARLRAELKKLAEERGDGEQKAG